MLAADAELRAAAAATAATKTDAEVKYDKVTSSQDEIPPESSSASSNNLEVDNDILETKCTPTSCHYVFCSAI